MVQQTVDNVSLIKQRWFIFLCREAFRRRGKLYLVFEYVERVSLPNIEHIPTFINNY